jgi:tRNA threonylcarbamoyladenosine biosynthesis protein TsaB
MNMNILSVEASTESCSAAFCTEDNIFVRHQIAPREHSKLLLNMIDELLKEANIGIQNIDAFAYGMGPGSFTGLRIAASIVQGLAFGTNKEVIPVSTLQALAQAAWRKFGYKQVFATLDARMQEIYFGFYELDKNNIMQNICPDRLTSPEYFIDLPEELLKKNWYGIGSGVAVYHEVLKKRLPCVSLQESILYPSALEIAIIANKIYEESGGKPAETAIPVYLRNKITEKQVNTIAGALFKK